MANIKNRPSIAILSSTQKSKLLSSINPNLFTFQIKGRRTEYWFLFSIFVLNENQMDENHMDQSGFNF